MSDASPTIRIRALRDLDVDNVRIPQGTEAEIRRELVADLVACGAAEDELDATTSEGEGAEGSVPGGPAPQPAQPGELEPGVPAVAQDGDDSPLPGAAGDGDAAAGAAADEVQPAEQAAAAVSVGEAPAAAAPPAGRPGKKR